jgi:hypothetical protein
MTALQGVRTSEAHVKEQSAQSNPPKLSMAMPVRRLPWADLRDSRSRVIDCEAMMLAAQSSPLESVGIARND